ncbi:SGNH/GDSL hydrolase family protein [Pseudomonas juntendi]|uniref:SGNH/GDSL hydrolase family protein n=1 Tax=Pseudomonas juntendi TaxID=2666183 RepID=UPI00244A41EC|nr:SGNH/GDSL hydrolase family protein [Pseudomonas juntendi]MDG9808563.1 SGNH/GDSL hydrolase family protein [Pseudomonas juntendi]
MSETPTIEALIAYAGDLSDAAARSKAASLLQHEYVNGDDGTSVITEGGVVPSLARQALLADEKLRLFIATAYGVFDTKALMDADLLADPGQFAQVANDPNLKLNGWYSKLGASGSGSWKWIVDQPATGTALNEVAQRTSVLETEALRSQSTIDAEFVLSFVDDDGRVSIGTREDGTVYIAGATEDIQSLKNDAVTKKSAEDTTNYVMSFADDTDAVALGITDEGLVVGNFEPSGLSAVSTYIARAPKILGLTVLASASKIRYGGQVYKLSDIAAVAATSVSETVADYSLGYIAPISMPVQEFLKVDAAQWLGYSSVSITSVTNQATGALLVPGVDYAYTENGKLALINPGAAIQATVKFVGYKERYDLLAYNLLTQSLVIRQGVERRITAHEDLYRAKPQAGDIPLYSLYVVGPTIKSMIDVSAWRGTRHRASNAEQAALIEQNRYRLRRFLTKLNRGDGVIVTGYGDSNTALGGARGDDTAYLPNRAGVDTYVFQGDYLLSTFEADFRSAYLAAVGQVTVNGQVRYKTSPNWIVIDKICSGYGYSFAADRIPGSREVVYLNQGIATTTAGNTSQGGTTPARLAAMISPVGYRTPDLVIIAFGMNDRTDVAYVSNIEQIVSAVKAAGADAIIVGPHLTNTFSASFTEETWHLVHRRLMECADRLGVAFMPSELFYAGKNRGYLGVSDYSLTRANFANHPGPYEYRMFGEALASTFL